MKLVDLRGFLISDNPLVEAQHATDKFLAQAVESFTISDNGIITDRLHRTGIYLSDFRRCRNMGA